MAGGFLFWGSEEEHQRQTEVLSLADTYSTWDRRGSARDTWNSRLSVQSNSQHPDTLGLLNHTGIVTKGRARMIKQKLRKEEAGALYEYKAVL